MIVSTIDERVFVDIEGKYSFFGWECWSYRYEQLSVLKKRK